MPSRLGNRFFVKDDGQVLPVADDFLLSTLSPTSPGTQYWESPPPAEISDRQRGRVLLQMHQILEIFAMLGVSLEGKNLCDVGTGNGLVPRLLLEYSGLSSAVGIDPYLDGEHQTSWQPHDHNLAFRDIKKFVDRISPATLDYTTYASDTKYEHMAIRPRNIPINRWGSKQYRFVQNGAHDVHALGEIFDIIYCKAIEHINNWDGVFDSLSRAVKPGAVVYFKHRSFFSYLGPHRYSSTMIPWGHVLLSDDEYRRYSQEFHSERADEMCEFFFSGLTYPRYSVSDMLKIASTHGFVPKTLMIEPARYVDRVLPFIGKIPKFWEILQSQYPNVSVEELFSGMYHIVFRKTDSPTKLQS